MPFPGRFLSRGNRPEWACTSDSERLLGTFEGRFATLAELGCEESRGKQRNGQTLDDVCKTFVSVWTVLWGHSIRLQKFNYIGVYQPLSCGRCRECTLGPPGALPGLQPFFLDDTN